MPAKLNMLNKGDDLEIRMIVWKTDSLQAPNGVSADYFVQAIFVSDAEEKDDQVLFTDNHNNCTDGDAVFNYRMCF